MRYGLLHLLVALFILVVHATPVVAQDDIEEILRVRTRVVFVDVLVKDKRTSEPITNLTREAFEVLDEGKPRRLSYFSQDRGEHPRPLAVILLLDLWGGLSLGANETEVAETAKRMASVLVRLPARDEVAIIASWFSDSATTCLPAALAHDAPPSRTLHSLTRNHVQAAAALHDLPNVIRRRREAEGRKRPSSHPQPGFRCAIDEVSRMARERPGSQVILVVVTDDYFNFFSDAETHDITEKLQRLNVTTSGLLLKKNALGRFADVLTDRLVSTPVSLITMKHLIEQTGGLAARVRRPDDYAAALEKIIGNMSARYSLGFALGENEQDDGQMHPLEVKVKALDSRGKQRKLTVNARRGYFRAETGHRVPR
jgi:VWFA-related protein